MVVRLGTSSAVQVVVVPAVEGVASHEIAFVYVEQVVYFC
jgi:hypothetical protein